jgi:outer membrane immunogenic protein
MPIKAPAKVLPAVYNWTVLYFGAHGGYAWGSSRWIDDPLFGAQDLGSHTITGGFGGGQIGYNWQTGQWVLGSKRRVAERISREATLTRRHPIFTPR